MSIEQHSSLNWQTIANLESFTVANCSWLDWVKLGRDTANNPLWNGSFRRLTRFVHLSRGP